MVDNHLLILTGEEILNLFDKREQEILQTVKLAYQIHTQGDSNLPHSSFLRFPNNDKNRIIALPAYLGGKVNTAGIKWIASFPNNLTRGIERASAALILNSTETGQPLVFMESSVISAKRTAASAVLAAQYLLGEKSLTTVGMIGCGLINFETFRFFLSTYPKIETLYVYDLSLERAEMFNEKCLQLSNNIEIVITEDPRTVLQSASVTALATTAIQPHIFDISDCNSGSVILHTSLRDLSPEIILSADNVVDDIDHVCRAQTSIHLAEQQTGNKNFIRCTLSDIFNGTAEPRQENKISIFSPFGLGILDLALGQLVYKLAIKQNQGTHIKSFFPVP